VAFLCPYSYAFAYHEYKFDLVLYYTQNHKCVRGRGGIRSTHFYSAIDGYEWLAYRAGLFTPDGNVLCTHWIGGWVGPTGGGAIATWQ
jgi:hypothetical protein